MRTFKNVKNFTTSAGLILIFIFGLQNISANEFFVDHAKSVYPLQKSKFQTKKLRYLFASNGGLIGFFSDGSVSSCPRCELTKANVNALSKKKPYTKYTVKKDHLLVKGERMDFYIEGTEISPDWVIMDYKKLSDY